MTFGLENRPNFILKHAAGWMAFMAYELVSLFYFSGQWTAVGDALPFYTLHIALFYFHAGIVLPFAFTRTGRPYVVCVLMVLLEMVVYLVLKYLIDYYLEAFRLSIADHIRMNRYIFLNAWRGLYFIGFSTVYWLIRRLLIYRSAIADADRKQLMMEKDLAEARYAHLQQQISPHFLFNTLNFVYNAVYKYSAVASGAIQQLSEMMRYSLKDMDASGRTALADEAEHISNFVAINCLRYNFDLYIDLQMPVIPDELKIIPLVLLTFTENVFKHGNLKTREHPARIRLSVNEQKQLSFTTWNLKKKKAALDKLKSLGVQNALKRLEYTYGDQYDLKITEDDDTFYLELTITL